MKYPAFMIPNEGTNKHRANIMLYKNAPQFYAAKILSNVNESYET